MPITFVYLLKATQDKSIHFLETNDLLNSVFIYTEPTQTPLTNVIISKFGQLTSKLKTHHA